MRPIKIRKRLCPQVNIQNSLRDVWCSKKKKKKHDGISSFLALVLPLRTGFIPYFLWRNNLMAYFHFKAQNISLCFKYGRLQWFKCHKDVSFIINLSNIIFIDLFSWKIICCLSYGFIVWNKKTIFYKYNNIFWIKIESVCSAITLLLMS